MEAEAKKLLNYLGRTIAVAGYVIPDVFKITISGTHPTEKVITANSIPMEFMVTISIGTSQIVLVGNKEEVLHDLSLVVKGGTLILSSNLQREE